MNKIFRYVIFIFGFSSWLVSTPSYNFWTTWNLSALIKTCVVQFQQVFHNLFLFYSLFSNNCYSTFYPSLQQFNPMYLILLSIDILYHLKEIMTSQNELPQIPQLTSSQLFQATLCPPSSHSFHCRQNCDFVLGPPTLHTPGS